MAMGKILVVESGRNDLHTRLVRAEGFEAIQVDSLMAAEQAFALDRPDVVLLDRNLGEGGALDFIRRLRDLDNEVPILLLLDPEFIHQAAEAVRFGAEQFLSKPVDPAALAVVLGRIFERVQQRKRNLAEESRKIRFAVSPFFGTSAAVQRFEEQVTRVIMLDRPVLIQGETGVGKSALARWIHNHGPRKSNAFVELNCAGLGKEMLESELFGHEKGAFTGAVATKPGLLEVAHRGTIFMDEIGDMDLAVQPKILKAIEERQYRHMGGTEDRTVDARLIAASHKDLQQLVADGRFRSDLYYRIAGLPILVPPLRERKEDIVPLANYFLSRFASEWRCGSLELAPATSKILEQHDWPGNIRELKNALERAIIYRQGHVLQPSDFQLGTMGPGATTMTDTSLTLAEVEERHIQQVLEASGGRVDEAARRLDISRSSLYQRMQRLGPKNRRG